MTCRVVALCSLCILNLCLLTGCSGVFGTAERGRIPADSPPTLYDVSKKAKLGGEQRLVNYVVPAEHVRKLPKPRLELTPEVKQEMNGFLKGRGRFISTCLSQREEHYPELVEIFHQQGIPTELINVALIESGFRNGAVSPAGAVGMWQFMKGTARLYGLTVNWTEDERKDPVRSTEAAAKHLKDLYLSYKDWYLALAAYNAGPGAIDRALLKTKTDNFWSLSKTGALKTETVRYVARFVAATLIVQNWQQSQENKLAFALDETRHFS